jgi:transcriptional regulator with XRE-family HTH domain
MADDQVQYLKEMLATQIRRQRITRRSIEQRMGWSHGYLTRLMGGVIELKLRHVFDILAMIDVSPAEFFAESYPLPPGRTRPERAATGSGEATEVRLVVLTDEQLEQQIADLVRRLTQPQPAADDAEPEPESVAEPRPIPDRVPAVRHQRKPRKPRAAQS